MVRANFPPFTEEVIDMVPPQASNPVAHPSHYNQGKYEPIDVIHDWQLPFELGNTIKYISRYRYKGNALEDLKKAKFYLDYFIEAAEKEMKK